MAAPSLTGIQDLPPDLLLSIFSLLPVPDLARCSFVCEQWHEILTEFTHLWKGKRYVTNRRASASVETRAVLRALPPLQEVIIEPAPEFEVDVTFPQLILSTMDKESVQECPRLTCEYLWTRLDIAGDILASRSTIDFAALRKLRLYRIPTFNVWARAVYTAHFVTGFALELLPNLRELLIDAELLSTDYLDMLERLGQLKMLEILCYELDRLTFLRHCSALLEEIHLCCPGLPSQEFAQLRLLGNLRVLRLSDCRVTEGDLEAGVAALGCLEALQLKRCDLVVRRLALVQRCRSLRELRLALPPVAGGPLTLTDPRLRRHQPHMDLSVDVDVLSLHLRSVDLNVDGLPAALPLLEDLGLGGGLLDQLASLQHCTELHRLCLEFQLGPDGPESTIVRVHTKLTSSA